MSVGGVRYLVSFGRCARRLVAGFVYAAFAVGGRVGFIGGRGGGGTVRGGRRVGVFVVVWSCEGFVVSRFGGRGGS